MNYSKVFPALLSAGMLYSWPQAPLLAQSSPASKVAFLADIHLQDVYGDFQSAEFKGVLNPKTGKFATIRTMASQLNSTRLFNENYFALLAALEELKDQGVKLVVLPGDYTDDGQPMNILALKRILEDFSTHYGMRFYITTGNHDPVAPFGSHGGKSDFLGEQGNPQGVYSENRSNSEKVTLSEQVKHWGYFEICEELSAFGFSPSSKDVFWTHPFIPLDYGGYQFEQALASYSIRSRLYPDPTTGRMLPDASYLVEPVEGLWLLALDGNVFRYNGKPESTDSTAWSGSSMGFNLAAEAKNHQLEWIKKISAEAKRLGKTLVSFSHYPLVDFHDGSSDQMAQLFGKGKFQLDRVPEKEISQRYAEAGIRVHVAGHMHLNDTGILRSPNGISLVNIQVPSLAAFPPSYKILDFQQPQSIEVQTQLLDQVPRFDEFFDLYRLEHQWLRQQENSPSWELEILEVDDYLNFTQTHLAELTKGRFLKSDWPEELGKLVQQISTEQLVNWLDLDQGKKEEFLSSILNSNSKKSANGSLLEDFYLIKNGGDLGIDLIPSERMKVYRQLESHLPLESTGSLSGQLADFLQIFSKLCSGAPSDDFWIDLEDLQVRDKQ